MALTYDEAYAATDPNAPEAAREQSANLLVLGSRANDVYWNSRSELEALKASATGHGEVTRGSDSPTEVATPTDANTIEGTATEEPTTALASGHSETAPATTSPAESESSDSDKLRAQLRNAGITPEV